MCEGGSLADIMRLRKRPYN